MTPYDRIAEIYDVDMGRNMAFDDVAFYVEACREADRVLELGCGNGRILLDLLAHGIAAIGVDTSHRMLSVLQRKAAARGLATPVVCRMDVRALGFRPAFDVVLCPYSLATYLLTDDDFAQMAKGIHAALHPRGMLVIDAFVPRPVVPTAGFTLDYRRAHDDEELVRSKRITALDAERNRIERRYERHALDGALLETIEVSEEIRPLTPDKLRALVIANGFAIEREWWNYGASDTRTNAQFFALAARREPLPRSS
ncbi:MAG TPA: class I SAM-dependent methyltransferase [Casimicrobiaceae bacterium]|nr:class I SAM-dependent methyltransferase [Casimicrobiaceae bacterium]